MRTIYLIISILIFASGCKSYKQVYNCTFYNSEKRNGLIFSSTNLHFNTDGTYDYQHLLGYGPIKFSLSRGKWEMDTKRKRILMNSDIEDVHYIPLSVKESSDSTKNFVFTFNSEKFLSSVFWFLTVNDKIYPMQSDTLIIPSNFALNDFYIQGYDSKSVISSHIPRQETIRSEVYYVDQSSPNNVFNLELPENVTDDIFYYEPFSDKYLEIKNNYLKWDRYGKIFKLRMKECDK